MNLAPWQKKALAAAIALTIYAVMDYSIRQADWGESAGDAEDMGTLANALFEEHVIALEVLGILLTAAMIGAMVIARPLDGLPDKDNYPRVEGEVAASQAVSDVDANLEDKA